MPAVALVLVSHSAALAAGVRELAAQMAPDVTICTAGGLPGGGLGTDVTAVQAALADALAAAQHAVVLCDLGSAVMTAETAVELLDQPGRAVLLDAPIVEGAVAAAVAAQGGSGADEVVASGRAVAGRAGGPSGGGTPAVEAGGGTPAAPASATAAATRSALEQNVVLRNRLGLHARPAAALAAAAHAASRDGTVLQVGRPGRPLVDASAVLRVMGLALRGGDEVRLVATGPGSRQVLTRVAALVEAGFGELQEQPRDRPHGLGRGVAGEAAAAGDGAEATGGTGVLRGVPASPGTAVGPVVVLPDPSPVLPDRPAGGPDQERQRSEAAREVALRRLQSAGAAGGAGIPAMHAALLTDPDLDTAVRARLEAGEPAETAWWLGAGEVADAMAASRDAFVAERAADVRDVALRVLDALGVSSSPPAAAVTGGIVVAEDVPPSWVPVLAEAGMAGLALAGSGATGHALVLARGLGVPGVAVLGPSLLPEAAQVSPDAVAILDGTNGSLSLAPSDEALATARANAAAETAAAEQRRVAAQSPVTVHGRVVAVLANVSSLAESARARAEGADGVGLLRTELLLHRHRGMPGEDEQAADLVAIASEHRGRRVVVRTFDLGGDKPTQGLDMDPLRNGFLGERGLRLSLARRELLRPQLRAVLRAAASLAPSGTRVALMVPMVTVADEVEQLRAELTAARQGLARDGLEAGELDGLGVMVEVPAAALAVAELAPLVDFVSVGTNDLVQYVMSAERTNPAVAHLYRPDHPAVWRLLRLLVADAHAHGVTVAVCGQMAADPELAVRLVELGVDELSVPPGDVARTKEALRRLR